jgi:DNA helicase IV
MERRAQGVAAQAMANRASAGPERDAIVESGLRRVKHLQIGDEPLVFGRIDNVDKTVYHIGRVAVYDADHEPLVTDWRAPAAEPFYRATPSDALGVIRRRHILSKDRKVVHLEDELLDAAHASDEDLVLVGEAALLNALRRSRSGRMRDIVATIQREQDEVIRAPLEGVLVVQGGPGTGKTAVVLHRAAYLLYAHRERLTRMGVLVIGPNAIFMRYIEQVLPTLGESATLSSIGELVDGIHATADDPLDVARIKGDVRMAKIVRRAVNQLERGLDAPETIEWEGAKLVLSVAASRHIVKVIRERIRGTHNAKRPDIRDLTIGFLFNKWLKQQRRWAGMFGEDTRETFEKDLREDEHLSAVLDKMWPVRSAEDLVRTLTSDERVLARAAKGALDASEQKLLLQDSSERELTENDVALIDEALPMLGPTERRRRRRPKIDPEERFAIERLVDDLQELEPVIRAERQAFIERLVEQRLDIERGDEEHKKPPRELFGHVVIDEAQSLTPMQWRMIARRVPAKSMTIVGDLGQNTGAYAQNTWDDVILQLNPANSSVVELSINYRSPEPIAQLANRVLAVAAPDLVPPRSVRTDGDPPRVVGTGDVITETAKIARSEVSEDGTVAVLADHTLVPKLRAELGIRQDADAASLLDERIAVLTVDDARGLEFDSVVVVEPSGIEAESGLRAIYVAITRATRALTIVHNEPLPAALRA